MRATQLKKTVAMSGAMFIALMGATAPADAHAPHQGQGHHEKNGKQKSHENQGHGNQAKADQAHANHGQAKKSQTKKSQAPKSQGATTHGNAGSHGAQGGSKGGSKAGDKAGKGGDPAGNNGTVKIAPLGDFDGIPNNTPHVGCDFLVEWYGFDEGEDIISTVTFAMQAPTKDVGLTVGGPTNVFVGGDPASGAGTDTGLDGRQEYHLSFDGAPHPKQGYHVKLTINTPGSIGADVKHKVFWVQGCEDTTTPPGGGEETPPGGGEETPPGDTDTPPEVEGEQGHAPHSGQPEVKGAQALANQAAQAAVPTVVDSGLVPVTRAVSTATDQWPLALSLVGLCLLGVGMLTRRVRS